MAEKDRPHAAHIPEETFLRMKRHFPAWATFHRDPYLTDRKQEFIPLAKRNLRNSFSYLPHSDPE